MTKHLPRFEYYLSEVPMKAGASKPRQDYRWRLVARNGETLASGEGFTTKASVKRAIDAVRNAVAVARMVGV